MIALHTTCWSSILTIPVHALNIERDGIGSPIGMVPGEVDNKAEFMFLSAPFVELFGQLEMQFERRLEVEATA